MSASIPTDLVVGVGNERRDPWTSKSGVMVEVPDGIGYLAVVGELEAEWKAALIDEREGSERNVRVCLPTRRF